MTELEDTTAHPLEESLVLQAAAHRGLGKLLAQLLLDRGLDLGDPGWAAAASQVLRHGIANEPVRATSCVSWHGFSDEVDVVVVAVSARRPERADEIGERLGWPVIKVKQVKSVAKDPVSLETPVGEDEDSELGDFVEDKKAPSPLQSTAQSILAEQLKQVLATLPAREQKVIRMRFGLDDGYTHTLEEVGYVFKVTRERIRQIEAKALRRLRAPTRMRRLRDFLDQN